MGKYVLSDIHGCYNTFLNMLELINFKEDDELYILGDIIDRGPNSLSIIDYVIDSNNITVLKGNHEKMFEEYVETSDHSLWYYNGGARTHAEIRARGNEYECLLYRYIKQFPYILLVDKYILVHAGIYLTSDYQSLDIDKILNQNEETCVWDRNFVYKPRKYKDYTVICGHTPVQTITDSNDNPSILKEDGLIVIDCGCVFKHRNGRLACLRLDDMEEFYVERID